MLFPAQTTKNKYTNNHLPSEFYIANTKRRKQQTTLTIKRHYTEQEVAIIHFSHNGYDYTNYLIVTSLASAI